MKAGEEASQAAGATPHFLKNHAKTVASPVSRLGPRLDHQGSHFSIRRSNERRVVDAKEEVVYKVDDLVRDLADGVILCQLAAVLHNVPHPRCNLNPTMPPQMIDNAVVALRVFAEGGLSFASRVDPKIFTSKDRRLILGFMWQLIESEMMISGRSSTRNTDPNNAAEEVEDDAFIRKETYAWVQRYVADYQGVPNNLEVLGPKGFRDGRVLSFMLHKAKADAINLAEMELQSPHDRLGAAIMGARKELDVPLLITADTLEDRDASDRALLTYLFAFRDCVESRAPPATVAAASSSSPSNASSWLAPVASIAPPAPAPSKDAEKGRKTTIRGNPKTNSVALQRFEGGAEHAKLNCPVCSQSLTGLLVKVMPEETLYHDHCFACKTCNKSFECFYWPYGGVPYCFEHYLDAAGLMCATCNGQIRENAVAARGRKYHSPCFVCVRCKQEFAQTYNIFEGMPYCDQHYREVAGQTCTACGKDIDEQAIKALSGLWHKRCFACKLCATQILKADGKPLPFLAMEGHPVCQDCHARMTDNQADICCQCGKDIGGESVSAMGKMFCNACFACHKCRKSLTQSFFNVGGQPYCEGCARATAM